jgi:hypothetical protein
MHHLRKRTGSVDIDALHHGGFRGMLERRHDESPSAAAFGFQGDREDALDRAQTPDNASSPVMQNASRAGNRLFSSNFSIAMTIGRSKLGPSFLADIRRGQLMVILFPYGQRNELLEMAEVTRSLLSLTAVSGNPTTAILSVFPHPAWTSISTSNASTPTTAAQ